MVDQRQQQPTPLDATSKMAEPNDSSAAMTRSPDVNSKTANRRAFTPGWRPCTHHLLRHLRHRRDRLLTDMDLHYLNITLAPIKPATLPCRIDDALESAHSYIARDKRLWRITAPPPAGVETSPLLSRYSAMILGVYTLHMADYFWSSGYLVANNYVLKYGVPIHARQLRYATAYCIPVWRDSDGDCWGHGTCIITFPPTSVLSKNLSTGLSVAEVFCLIALATRLRDSIRKPTYLARVFTVRGTHIRRIRAEFTAEYLDTLRESAKATDMLSQAVTVELTEWVDLLKEMGVETIAGTMFEVLEGYPHEVWVPPGRKATE